MFYVNWYNNLCLTLKRNLCVCCHHKQITENVQWWHVLLVTDITPSTIIFYFISFWNGLATIEWSSKFSELLKQSSTLHSNYIDGCPKPLDEGTSWVKWLYLCAVTSKILWNVQRQGIHGGLNSQQAVASLELLWFETVASWRSMAIICCVFSFQILCLLDFCYIKAKLMYLSLFMCIWKEGMYRRTCRVVHCSFGVSILSWIVKMSLWEWRCWCTLYCS